MVAPGRAAASTGGAAAAPDATTVRQRRTVVVLLFLFMLVNFLDKTVIGLAAAPIMNELHLTHLQFGAITSSFFYLFSLSAVLVGFLATRIAARWAIFGMGLVWGLSQLPLFGPVGPGVLVASRVALGAGEGPAYPIAVHAVHKWYPDEQRSLPAAIIGQGSNFGVVLILPLLNWILIRYSWHVACGCLGLLAIAWSLLWLAFGREGPGVGAESPASSAPRRIPYSKLILNRTILGGWAAGFGAYWSLSLLVSWFTPYLVQGLGVSQARAGVLSGLPWACAILSTVFGAWLSQRLSVRGVSSRYARGVLSGAFVAAGGLLLLLLSHLPAPLKLPCLVLGLALPGVVYAVSTAIAGEIAPPSQRSALLGLGSAVATSAGLIAPVVMGGLIDKAASMGAGYESGFALNGAVAMAGGVIGMLLIDPPHTKARLARFA
jgi:MFS family permease